MKDLIKDHRFLLLFALLAYIAWSFWTGSRYPALDTKALMAGSLNMQDGLSFDAWLKHRENESWLEQIAVTYLNWIYTNRQGMGFGLMFAVVAMSLVPLIKKHIFFRPSGWNASFMGFIIGAPLGVCVNCAAPIAYGLYKSGTRAELAIATMISSPTFNIIVLSMLVTLFAWPLAVIKIAITLGVIFVLVPLLLKVFSSEVYAETTDAEEVKITPLNLDIEEVQADSSIAWVLKTLWKNAWYLLTRVVPIMLLAGLIGTLAVSLLPWDLLNRFNGIQGYALILLTMFALSLFGLLLPVPMAFDVILAATLVNAGVPIKYAAVLLFSLGTFSVYSYMILWRAGAKRVASGLFVSLVGCGVVAGLASDVADEKYRDWEVRTLYSQLNDDTVVRHTVTAPSLHEQTISLPPKMTIDILPSGADYTIASMALPAETNSLSGSQTWSMQRVEDDGFLMHERPIIDVMTESISLIAGLSAGDINHDGWQDVLVGTPNGPFLYLNTGGRFALSKLPFQDSINTNIGAVALQDMDNDGNLDIYFSKLNEGSYVSYNRNSVFENPIRLNYGAPFLTVAAAFGDLDKNGWLDVVEAYHSGLAYLHVPGESSRNQVFYQNNNQFTGEQLPGIPAETLTLLLSDLNNDNSLDLLVGNDFDEPDVFYWGSANGSFSQWASDSIVTTESTMSLDSADINNDLDLETYHAQITRNPASPPAIVPEQSVELQHARLCNPESTRSADVERRCEELVLRMVSSWDRGTAGCNDMPEEYKYDCIAARWYIAPRLASNTVDSTILKRWYPDYAENYDRIYAVERKRYDGDGLSQVLDANLLYAYEFDGGTMSAQEQAKELNIDIGGWSWNAKFADLDGDEWQDLYIANGFRNMVTDISNLWFQNLQGEQFEQRTDIAGLIDFEHTSSSLYVDIDNDGDLDLITYLQSGKLKTWVNTHSGNQHLQVELDDHRGNRRGIGSKITIYYADGLHQIREVKASGGYFSHDSSIVHFGLGGNKKVESIDVQWSTGETSSHIGPFETQQRLKISRTKSTDS